MKVAILGYGVDGISAVEYWRNQGAEITVCDQKTDLTLPAYVDKKLGADYLKNLSDFDLIVRTPGLHPRLIADANPNAPDILKKVTTTVNEFCARCPAPIIGVTGTKGKGTTSTLIYEMLSAAGKKCWLGGNIGVVPLDFLDDITPDSVVVLELSNYQLIDFKHAPSTAVCLMVVPEHLNWHGSVEEYFNAKGQLFARQPAEQRAVYNIDNEISHRLAVSGKAQLVGYHVPAAGLLPDKAATAYVKDETIFMDKQAVCAVKDVALRGRHNLQNICAAVAAVWPYIGDNLSAIREVITKFASLPHRLELVRELDGVTYFDDSYGTTPETAIAAIQAFEQPKVIILGGSDKGATYHELAQVVAMHNVRSTVLIGNTAPQIEDALKTAGYNKILYGGETMADIVRTARFAAKSGDVVLLSPACASFGLFKNYEDRGNQFKTAVNNLS